jgi:hypothetical protein
LYEDNKLQNNGSYNVVILREQDESIMADIRIYNCIESWGTWLLVDVKVFQNMEQITTIWVTWWNWLVMLGLE